MEVTVAVSSMEYPQVLASSYNEIYCFNSNITLTNTFISVLTPFLVLSSMTEFIVT